MDRNVCALEIRQDCACGCHPSWDLSRWHPRSVSAVPASGHDRQLREWRLLRRCGARHRERPNALSNRRLSVPDPYRPFTMCVQATKIEGWQLRCSRASTLTGAATGSRTSIATATAGSRTAAASGPTGPASSATARTGGSPGATSTSASIGGATATTTSASAGAACAIGARPSSAGATADGNGIDAWGVGRAPSPRDSTGAGCPWDGDVGAALSRFALAPPPIARGRLVLTHEGQQAKRGQEGEATTSKLAAGDGCLQPRMCARCHGGLPSLRRCGFPRVALPTPASIMTCPRVETASKDGRRRTEDGRSVS